MPFGLGFFAAAGAGAAATPAIDLIQTTVLSSNQTSITFSSIPSTYKHLQIRAVSMNTNTNQDHLTLRFNGNSSASYIDRYLGSGGAAVESSSNSASQTAMRLLFSNAYNGSTAWAISIIDILDYSSTSKNKTVRLSGGYNWPTQRTRVHLASGAWFNTSAVTSITIAALSDSLLSASRFSLYGIRG